MHYCNVQDAAKKTKKYKKKKKERDGTQSAPAEEKDKTHGSHIEERTINLDDFPPLIANKTKPKATKKNVECLGASSVVKEPEQTVSNVDTNKLISNNDNSSKFVLPKCDKQVQKSVDVSSNIGENKFNVCDVMKKTITKPLRNPHKKKRAEPILFKLEEALEVNRIKKKIKQRSIKGKFQRSIASETLSGNILDSSNPKRNRGKHREIKKRKLTKLKLLIIKERIMKRKAREKDVKLDNVDFKSEIEKYLKEFSRKKIEMQNKKQEKDNGTLKSEAESKTDVPKNDKNSDSPLNEQDLNKTEILVNTKSKNCKSNGNKSTKKLREYCSNVITDALNTSVTALIKGLIAFQDRAFLRDPIKAKARKRHVSGLKEVKKHLTLKKVKMLIIPPNLEKLYMEGSLGDVVNELKSLAEEQNVPCVFALDRHRLGRCTKKNVSVSAFAVLNYEGLESNFEDVLHHLEDAKKQFLETTIETKEKSNEEHLKNQIVSSMISIFREKLTIGNENSQEGCPA